MKWGDHSRFMGHMRQMGHMPFEQPQSPFWIWVYMWSWLSKVSPSKVSPTKVSPSKVSPSKVSPSLVNFLNRAWKVYRLHCDACCCPVLWRGAMLCAYILGWWLRFIVFTTMRRVGAKHCASTTWHPVSRGGKHFKRRVKSLPTFETGWSFIFYGTHETHGTHGTHETHALRTTAIALFEFEFTCDFGRLKSFSLKSLSPKSPCLKSFSLKSFSLKSLSLW